MRILQRRFAVAELIELSVRGERRRLLAELHDLAGQELTMLALECDLALAAAGEDPSASCLSRMRQCVNRLARAIALLAEAPVAASLPDCLDRAGRDLATAGITLVLDVPEHIADLPHDTRALLACAVREGVTNVLRHAPTATMCQVSASQEAGGVILTIRNDGVTGRGSGRPGAGVTGLRDRGASMGARIRITADGDSFTLAVHVPPRDRGAIS